MVCGQETGIDSESLSEFNNLQPPLPALSLPAVQASVSRVMSDIISTYSEFDPLSKRLACIMSSTSAVTVCDSPTLSPPKCTVADSDPVAYLEDPRILRPDAALDAADEAPARSPPSGMARSCDVV